jgi:L-threonylcarbamoyladenylate synthase
MDFSQDIKEALSVLKNGGIILYPTDTIWGIGCDACHEEAVKKVYELKKRIDSKSMLILMDDVGRLFAYVREIPEIAYELIEASEKPLTLIYPGGRNLAPSLLAEDGSIGIRITKDPFCKDLIKKLNKPLVSTSANISGMPSPSVFNEISEEIKSGVDYIVKWRQDDKVKASASSIIKIDKGGLFRILRP